MVLENFKLKEGKFEGLFTLYMLQCKIDKIAR